MKEKVSLQMKYLTVKSLIPFFEAFHTKDSGYPIRKFKGIICEYHSMPVIRIEKGHMNCHYTSQATSNTFEMAFKNRKMIYFLLFKCISRRLLFYQKKTFEA